MVVPLSDGQQGFFPFEFKGLGNGANGCKLKNAAVFADARIRVNDHMRADFSSIADTDMIRNNGIGANRNIGAYFSFGTDNCSRVNHTGSP